MKIIETLEYHGTPIRQVMARVICADNGFEPDQPARDQGLDTELPIAAWEYFLPQADRTPVKVGDRMYLPNGDDV